MSFLLKEKISAQMCNVSQPPSESFHKDNFFFKNMIKRVSSAYIIY